MIPIPFRWCYMSKFNRFLFFCGLAMAFSEVWKQWALTFLVNHGTYNWWYFPFQLCSLPMYLCLLLPWIHSERIRGAFLTFLMDYGLLCGIFVFFDTSGMHYSYAPLTVHSYVWHILLIIMGLGAGLAKCTGYTWQEFQDSTLCYLLGCLAATVFNLAFHNLGTINMFYISPYYPMQQRVFEYFASILGNGWGILIYLAAIPTGALIFHFLWRILQQKLLSRLSG